MNQIPTAQSIRHAIVQALPCERLEVDGDGHHFEALIVSAAFEGRSRIERHRLVYAALGDRMRQEIHALSMRTLTPQEADAVGAARPAGR
ncbi:MAG TPA: BolA/IbaG family iron-sulfur metabolism protein [Burkholderiaceae bacterium]|nr:BolA/IbaG family iron-sulfur metabolism protein [Burkholderiaceae bacterium]HYA75694.1 BolA/IbaG family iron-sulfur metabolism protein [Burkholderiaceae bacterium]